MPTRKAAVVVAVLLAGCRHLAPPSALPSGWESLVRPAPTFAALYRMQCCRRGSMLATVRGDGENLAVSVTVPPGVVAVEAWLSGTAGWLRGKGCKVVLPAGEIPLSHDASLPLSAPLAALLLAGDLPAGSRETPGEKGWVEAAGDGWWLRARIETGPRCTRVLLGRPGDVKAVLVVALSDHRDRLPGRITLRSDAADADLSLVEWHSPAAAPPPAWLGEPACEGRS
jgi:hypothetical protein